MDAIKLARSCYEGCRSLLLRDYPEIMAASAIGLAGNYSPCFGLNPWPGENDAPFFNVWIADDICPSARMKQLRLLKPFRASLTSHGKNTLPARAIWHFINFTQDLTESLAQGGNGWICRKPARLALCPARFLRILPEHFRQGGKNFLSFIPMTYSWKSWEKPLSGHLFWARGIFLAFCAATGARMLLSPPDFLCERLFRPSS